MRHDATTWASQAPRETLAVGLVKAEAVLGKRCSSHEMAAMSAAVRSTRPMADPRWVGSRLWPAGNSRTSISRVPRRSYRTDETCSRPGQRCSDRSGERRDRSARGRRVGAAKSSARRAIQRPPKVECRSPLVQRRDLLSAESQHASVSVSAGPPLTTSSKQNSAALSPGFWFVAGPATRSRLLLPYSGSTERKPRPAFPATPRRPELRGCGRRLGQR
jgi:hypothetical protein